MHSLAFSLLFKREDIIPNIRPPRNWPSEGKVHFDRYSTRYRAELNLVLKDVTADVSGGQKVY